VYGKEGSIMVKDGKTVKVHYTGTLGDGTVFDTSVEREPLEFTMGEGKVIPGFEEAVKGMKVGQSKTVTIQANDAYGPHRDDLIIGIERTQLPANLNPEVGQRLQMQQANGRQSIVTVTDVSEETITLDTNHPLAGEDLTFELKLVEIT
jgi:peptidylprolyl isomerase